MAKNVWIAGGKKANAAALRDLLAQAFADKLGKLQELRASVLSEQEHSDARSINKETKKRWRLAEQEARRLERELRRVGGLVRKQEREQARSVILYTGSGARRAVPSRAYRVRRRRDDSRDHELFVGVDSAHGAGAGRALRGARGLSRTGGARAGVGG